MSPDLFGDYFEQFHVLAVCEIVLFYGGIDALKVINEECIATLCNVAIVRSPTLKFKFATQNFGRSIEFFQQTFPT